MYEVDTAFPVSRAPAEIAIIEKIHGRIFSGAHGTTSFCGMGGFMLSWILSQSLKVLASVSGDYCGDITFRPCLRGRCAKGAHDRPKQNEVRAQSTIFSPIREHRVLGSEKFCNCATERPDINLAAIMIGRENQLRSPVRPIIRPDNIMY